jgi:exonuclease VII large subunit
VDGLSYLLAQVALLLVLAGILGGLAGRYLRLAATPARRPWVGGTGTDTPTTGELERQLAAAEATAHELRRTVATITDHKDAEMGRLESRAIQAMDSLIASHQERVHALQSHLQTASAEARYHERELEAERRRTLRLQAALVDRDERIQTLTSDLADRDRRLHYLDHAPGPDHGQRPDHAPRSAVPSHRNVPEHRTDDRPMAQRREPS